MNMAMAYAETQTLPAISTLADCLLALRLRPLNRYGLIIRRGLAYSLEQVETNRPEIAYGYARSLANESTTVYITKGAQIVGKYKMVHDRLAYISY